jgi:hypothetical protein
MDENLGPSFFDLIILLNSPPLEVIRYEIMAKQVFAIQGRKHRGAKKKISPKDVIKFDEDEFKEF